MSDFAKIDKNFEVKSAEAGLKLYTLPQEPFRVYGVNYNAEKVRYERLEEEFAKSINEHVYHLGLANAGGRIRFKTDSSVIAVYVKFSRVTRHDHFPLTGSAGLDLYADNEYQGTFRPPYDMKDSFDSSIDLFSKEMRDITINMPLYSGISEISIGLEKDAVVEKGDEYRLPSPVLYYGSSITQGGCASRPGNSYQAIITRRLDIDHINLGFSGNAKGEKAMAHYIASIPMSAFVMDYDHNAPSVEHLEKTHKPFYDIIRKANPTLPVVFVSAPKYKPNEEKWSQRRLVILDTYNKAKEAGENVYFVDGMHIFDKYAKDSATVDKTHPNDLGFMEMADNIGEVLKDILK